MTGLAENIEFWLEKKTASSPEAVLKLFDS